MADDLSFAKQGLADWARSNGIYQIRDVLAQAASMAGKASNGEDLASLLLAEPAPSTAAKAPAAAPSPSSEETASKDSTRTKAVKK
jgi:hypothetical protein